MVVEEGPDRIRELIALGTRFDGHRDGDALESMVSGRVPAEWARRKAPRWYEEERAAHTDTDTDTDASDPSPLPDGP